MPWMSTWGSFRPRSQAAVKLLEDVPCDQLPSVLEGLIPYHTREKMHRSRGVEGGRAGSAMNRDSSICTVCQTIVGRHAPR